MVTVEEVLEEISFYEVDGPINNFISKLEQIKAKHYGKDVYLDLRYSQYNSWGEITKVIAVIWSRPENEKEKS